MSGRLTLAGQRLARALEQENAALDAHEFGRISTFLDEKRAALDGLHALASEPAAELDEVDASALRALAGQLQTLAAENKLRLERAMMVQNRIMSVIAGAAREAQVKPEYGAQGGRRQSVRHAGAVALVVRA
ncbi:MAG: hypothetical protein ACRYGL_11475 [Janthinobacterium lividum]